MSIASKTNKMLGKANKHFCNKIREDSHRKNYHTKYEPKKETEAITLMEQLFKGQDIIVFFEGKQSDLSDLRLKVYVNGKMKFVSQEGAFIKTVVKTPKVVRKGWFFTTTFIERERLKFEHQKEYERFQKFIHKLKDCQRVENMYKEQCYDYLKVMQYQCL